MTTLTTKSDAQIQQDVSGELLWDTYVAPSDVDVQVDHGVVTLTGTIRSFASRQAAQMAAYRVHGVTAVANHLEVHLPDNSFKTDLELATAIRWALEWDVLVPEELIQTSVTEGWVTLEGHVQTWTQCQDAEAAIQRLRGVRGITNSLAVQQTGVSAATIHAAVEIALERQADRLADDVQITVIDDTVTVRGRVRSWREKRAIMGAAGHAPGIAQLNDQLTIDPYS